MCSASVPPRFLFVFKLTLAFYCLGTVLCCSDNYSYFWGWGKLLFEHFAEFLNEVGSQNWSKINWIRFLFMKGDMSNSYKRIWVMCRVCYCKLMRCIGRLKNARSASGQHTCFTYNFWENNEQSINYTYIFDVYYSMNFVCYGN